VHVSRKAAGARSDRAKSRNRQPATHPESATATVRIGRSEVTPASTMLESDALLRGGGVRVARAGRWP